MWVDRVSSTLGFIFWGGHNGQQESITEAMTLTANKYPEK
jgi:hypothetical protein